MDSFFTLQHLSSLDYCKKCHQPTSRFGQVINFLNHNINSVGEKMDDPSLQTSKTYQYNIP